MGTIVNIVCSRCLLIPRKIVFKIRQDLVDQMAEIWQRWHACSGVHISFVMAYSANSVTKTHSIFKNKGLIWTFKMESKILLRKMKRIARRYRWRTAAMVEYTNIFCVIVPTLPIINVYFVICLRDEKKEVFCFGSSQHLSLLLGRDCLRPAKLCRANRIDTQCRWAGTVLAGIVEAATCVASHSIYGFLWLRQAIFNSSPGVSRFTPKFVKVSSWFHTWYSPAVS